MIKKNILILLIILAVIGLLDSTYLTREHFNDTIPPCKVGSFGDCGQVLESEYAEFAGFPLAGIGMLHYATLLLSLIFYWRIRHNFAEKLIKLLIFVGAIASAYFVYVMLVVLEAICVYCMVSAINSFALAAAMIYIIYYDN